MKIVATADPHLDATSVGGWDPVAGMHSTWVEAHRQLNAVVDAAIEQRADVLLIAGDVFHTGRPSAEAVALTTAAFDRLEHTKVVMLAGNHDQQSVLAEHRNPLDAYLSSHPKVAVVASVAQVVDVDGFAFALVPWPKVAGTASLAATSEELAAAVKTLGKDIAGRPAVMAGHITLSEASFDTPRRGAETTMSTSVLEATVATKAIEALPTAANLLGHIHRRQSMGKRTRYLGSTYRVSFSEANQAKGFEVIEVGDDNVATSRFVELDARNLIAADVSREGGLDALAVASTAKRGDVVRLMIDADADPANLAQAKAMLADIGASVQTPRKPKVRGAALARRGADLDSTPLAALRAYFEAKNTPEEQWEELAALFADISADA